MDLLREGLYPFVERELQAKHGDQWFEQAKQALGTDTASSRSVTSPDKLDVAALLSVLVGHWQYVFRYKLGKTERGLVGELQEVRVAWAHQSVFTIDDTNRALDSTKRLLLAVNAPQADEVDKQLQEVLRQKFEEMTKKETRKAAASSVEGKFTSGLPSWRDVITPHADVAGGNYMLAEFAADLWQVYQDQFDQEHRAPTEYTDPVEFYRRTYLTEGLADLLSLAMRRISGQAADPVVKLQTNFGGGKTHSMLGLFHLFSGVAPAKLTGIEPIMKKLGLNTLPKVHRAVMVGNKLSLTGFKKPDGIMVRTLWGELAWQLGHSVGKAKEAYELVREDDEKGVCPSALVTLLRKFSPCVVLIDEWVAYIRQMYGTPGLPAGSFDANITFAQSLTEAFKAAPGCFLVASLPASDIEIGGDGGREALKRLENVFDRVQSTWRPATTDECFEIVRRRLFQPMEADKFAARDAVARAFSDMYRAGGNDFPGECREANYEERIQRSYPVHPELFDRLFLDWSHLERFQKTRGVLRLMASVIHSLWEKQDGNLLILPATVPMDDPPVRDELTRYMDETWTSVIEKDVDGGNSLPLRLDRENPALGRVSACRRVARTLYMGSAPNAATQNRGIDDRRIKLGCVQPGEAPATFGDALRRLSDQATHVYVDQSRYWLATQPSVTRLAQDRAAQLDRKFDDVHAEIVRRVRDEQSFRGDFAKVYPCPVGSGEVPDEQEARLVILSPETPHIGKSATSPAMVAAVEYLERRGTSPRIYRNTLVFLAADRTRLTELEQAVRQHLAWHSIVIDATPNGDGPARLNLDNSQLSQAKTKAREADDTVKQRLPETYQWLIVPTQSNPQVPIEFSEVRLQGADRLAPRASKKLVNDGGLATKFAGTLLRMELDKIPLWRGESVTLKQLAEDFAQYVYLPRLKSPSVLIEAVRDGVSSLTWETEGFAYADSYDDKKKRYAGLKTAQIDAVVSDGRSVVVRSDTARKQLDAEAMPPPVVDGGGIPPPGGTVRGGATTGGSITGGTTTTGGGGVASPARRDPTRFYGTIDVDPERVARDAGRVAQEVLAHLVGIVDSDVEVSIEITASVKDGIDPAIVRAVAENCKTLKFRSFGFEA
jgi:hypothetical protein